MTHVNIHLNTLKFFFAMFFMKLALILICLRRKFYTQIDLVCCCSCSHQNNATSRENKRGCHFQATSFSMNFQCVHSGGPVQPGAMRAGILTLIMGQFSASAFFSSQSIYSSGIDISEKMASTGHSGRQASQSMQLSGLISSRSGVS